MRLARLRQTALRASLIGAFLLALYLLERSMLGSLPPPLNSSSSASISPPLSPPPPALATRKEPSALEQLEQVSAWKAAYTSLPCQELRLQPPGSRAASSLGQGPRAKCFASEAGKRDHLREVEPSFDVSLAHRVIYVPVMKAGTQMFQEVFRTRLRGRRITTEKALLEHLAKHNMKLDQFFVFSFVREPFKMFVSAYEEVNKYVMNNRTKTRGFGDVAKEREPERALMALDNVRSGQFVGLIPAHMYTQVWKLNRCKVRVQFVGKLENVDEDWRVIERKLGLEHKPLPVIHAADSTNWVKRAKTEPPSPSSKELLGRYERDTSGKFAELTKQVCDYYQADFHCFGYDNSPCQRT